MLAASSTALAEILPAIRSRAGQIDEAGEWPDDDLRQLAGIGALQWALPAEFGGENCSPLELYLRYEMLASASLTTTLVLSQRDSGVGMLINAEPCELRNELLCRLGGGEVWTTIGIAQLTTSRQRGKPALTARADGGDYIIDGQIPWATGATHCDFICSGAALPDGKQILFVLSTDLTGVQVGAPLPLVSLRGSHTSAVICSEVRLPNRQLLLPAKTNDLAGRRKGIPIGQSFLALGLANGALDLMGQIDSESSRTAQHRFSEQIAALRKRVIAYSATAEPDPADAPALRGETIDLALRCTTATVSLFKGTGLLEGHPAQRLAREALFLLVWSCPAPVVECTIDLLSQTPHG